MADFYNDTYYFLIDGLEYEIIARNDIQAEKEIRAKFMQEGKTINKLELV